jgi:hypothetical protein
MEWIEQNNGQWIEYAGQEWAENPDPFYLLKQIWTDDTYVYAATSDGLNIIELTSELAYAHVTYAPGFTSVWADDTKVYLATPTDGVKYIDKTCISGSTAAPYELAPCLDSHLNEPDILSDQVRYIHGNDVHMAIVTASGINYHGPDPYYQRTEGFTKFARKVFITSTGKMYYTTWDGNTWKVNVKYADWQDWTTPNKEYETGTFLINAGVDILDIFITEGTSFTGVNNTIFVATTAGVFVIDEEIDEGATYYTV